MFSFAEWEQMLDKSGIERRWRQPECLVLQRLIIIQTLVLKTANTSNPTSTMSPGSDERSDLHSW